MNDWIAQRAKAWAAAFAAGVMSAGLRATESALGIDFGVETEAAITAAVTSAFVYLIPNRAP